MAKGQSVRKIYTYNIHQKIIIRVWTMDAKLLTMFSMAICSVGHAVMTLCSVAGML